MSDHIVFNEVSKFYGEVLGVNRVSLELPPGITSLVGPNGSGKTTLMNLMTGLIQPTRGTLSVMGLNPRDAYEFFRAVGYCTQFDSFPKAITGWEFVYDGLRLHGMSHKQAADLTVEARCLPAAGIIIDELTVDEFLRRIAVGVATLTGPDVTRHGAVLAARAIAEGVDAELALADRGEIGRTVDDVRGERGTLLHQGGIGAAALLGRSLRGRGQGRQRGRERQSEKHAGSCHDHPPLSL